MNDETSTPKFCGECGNPRTVMDRFCGGCGNKFAQSHDIGPGDSRGPKIERVMPNRADPAHDNRLGRDSPLNPSVSHRISDVKSKPVTSTMEPNDPFSLIQLPLLGENGEPPGRTWLAANLTAAADRAEEWFSQLASISLTAWVSENSATPDEAESVLSMVRKLPWGESAVVFPDMFPNMDLATRVDFQQSSLAPKILSYMASKGVSGYEIAFVATSANGIVQVGRTWNWIGVWTTEFGTRMKIWFEIHMSDDGTESCYFFTNLLVATREPRVILTAALGVPAMASALLYIAETIFPSSLLITVPRTTSFSGVPEELIPTPLVSFTKEAMTCASLGDTPDGIANVRYEGSPKVLRVGYLIPESLEGYFDNVIPQVIDTLVNLATIVEDGFRNYRSDQSQASFDQVLYSDYIYFDGAEEGVVTAGHARWIPETQLGSLVVASEKNYFEGSSMSKSPEQKRTLEWVCNEGAGQVVGSAVNSLVRDYLIPEREFDAAKKLLNIAINRQFVRETSQSLAYLGQIHLAEGDRQLAHDCFESAFNWTDKLAASEAAYFLGTMSLEDGDANSALQYFMRGAEIESDSEFKALCLDRLTQIRQ